jgi:hypothetical protein
MVPRYRLVWVTLAALIGAALVTSAILTMEAGNQSRARAEAESDRFWSRFAVNGIYGERFDSLHDMALSADAVVVGSIVEARPGRVVRDLEAEAAGATPEEAATYFANVVIEVKANLAGPAQPGARLVVEFLVGSRGAIPGSAEGVPKELAVFVLRDKLVMAERYGWSEEQKKEAAVGLYVLETPETVFRDLNGKARVLKTADSGYIRDQNDRQFDELVRDLKGLLASWEP